MGVVEVEEGSSSLITQEVVKVLTDYYTDKIGQYLVAEQPGAGHLQLSSRPGRRVEAFTQQQLLNGLISVKKIRVVVIVVVVVRCHLECL